MSVPRSVNDKAISGRFNKVWVPGGSHQPVSAQVKSLAAMIQSGQSGGFQWSKGSLDTGDWPPKFGMTNERVLDWCFTKLLLTSQCLTF